MRRFILPFALTLCATAFGQPAPTAAKAPVIQRSTATGTSNLSVITVDAPVAKLAWDPASGLIYLSNGALPGASGLIADAIQALNPLTGQLGASTGVAAQSSSISISATGKYIYAGSTGFVERYSLPGLTPDLVIPVGNDPFGYPYLVGWVEASPVGDRTVAVVTAFSLATPPVAGVAIYDDGVPRPDSICASEVTGCTGAPPELTSLQWNNDASRLFGADSESLIVWTATSAGIQNLAGYGGVGGDDSLFGNRIHFDAATGRIYADAGAVFDASTGALVLRLQGVQMVVPDGALGKVFGLQSDSSSLTITSFDIHTGAALDSATVAAGGQPVDLIRWGTNGLAVAVEGGAVYVLSGSFVDSPVGSSVQPYITPSGVVPAGSTFSTISPGEWVSIYGGNLAGAATSWDGSFPTSLAGTSVTFNGVPGYLSYVSPGQINVQVPDLGSVPEGGSWEVADVVVQTANGTTQSTALLSLESPSVLLFDSKHVAAIILRFDGSGAYGGGTYDILGPTGTSLGYPTVAAKAGDWVSLFALGLGPTNPPVPAGQSFSGAAPLTYQIALYIGDEPAIFPPFAGLSGAGLYQINFQVPHGLGSGDLSLQIYATEGTRTIFGPVISLQ